MPYLYETHMHTAEVSACASSTAAEQAEAYARRGYAGVIVTDHFVNGNSIIPRDLIWEQKMLFFARGYQTLKREGERLGLAVFFGWEFTIRGSDFLTYGLDLDFLLAHPGLDRLPIESYGALVRGHGGYIAQAHPYRTDAWVERKYPVDPQYLDGLEVFNASMPDAVNAQADAFAKAHNIPRQSGSDSHTAELAFAGGVSLRRPAKDVFDIIRAIRTGKAGLIRQAFP